MPAKLEAQCMKHEARTVHLRCGDASNVEPPNINSSKSVPHSASARPPTCVRAAASFEFYQATCVQPSELSVRPSRRRPGCSRGTTSPLCISSRGTFLHFGRGLPHALDVPVECPMPMATPTVLGPGHATSQTLSPTSPYHCRP